MLRGINVSGQKLIKMKALQQSYEDLEFQNITTYLQSGNVIFTSEEVNSKMLEQRISEQIETDFGFNVPVIVLTIDKLKQVIDNNPFQKTSDMNQFVYVTFLYSMPELYNKESIENKKQGGEEVVFTDNVVFLYCPNGYGKTKLTNNFIETKLNVEATTRNWKTTNELLNIALETNKKA